MKRHRLILVGFGNVGRAFARLLLKKRQHLKDHCGLSFDVTGIFTARHGAATNPNGLDLDAVLKTLEVGQSLAGCSTRPAVGSVPEFLKEVTGDVMFETTPVDRHTGQPAIDHIKAGLRRGMHVVIANKGPVVHGYQELTSLARKVGRHFLFESAVMDGAPIFSLFRDTLPAVQLRGFHGILNSCTNLVLCRMEEGESFEDAVRYSQSIGLAETDPNADINGWDAAIKVAALCTVLMGQPLTPQQVDREGIRGITPQMLQEAKKNGRRWKLVCRARRENGTLQASVKPQQVGLDSPLYSINGSSSYCEFEMDMLPGLGIVESDPGPETTAYGMLADWISTLKLSRRRPSRSGRGR